MTSIPVMTTIQSEKSLEVFQGTKDNGYHSYGTQWWTNPMCPYAYKYLSLDSLYAAPYFDEGRGHPSYWDSNLLYKYMQETYRALFGKHFISVIEFGTGGGEITRHFKDDRIDYIAVEGTTAGVDKLKSLSVPEDRIIKQNIKFFKNLNRKFNLAMCTEVAEHIEPWFASKVVSNCVEHADVIWFSAAKGDAPPHYHHMNEAPIEAWDNIFAHFGFNTHVPLNGMMDRADRLYLGPEAINNLTIKI